MSAWLLIHCLLCGAYVRRQPIADVPETVCFDCWATSFAGVPPERLWLNAHWRTERTDVQMKYAALIEAAGRRVVVYCTTEDFRGILRPDLFLAGLVI